MCTCDRPTTGVTETAPMPGERKADGSGCQGLARHLPSPREIRRSQFWAREEDILAQLWLRNDLEVATGRCPLRDISEEPGSEGWVSPAGKQIQKGISVTSQDKVATRPHRRKHSE